MGNKALLGFKRYMIPIPGPIWRAVVSKNARKLEKELSFMSEEHHLVRNYVVQTLPRTGEPLSAEHIVDKMNMHIDLVKVILDDLEKHMTFLCRYGQSAVNWAYPVTVDQTPHRIAYSTGERGFAAWAVDSLAVPFVQGQLKKEPTFVVIESECAHCACPITIELDDTLKYRVIEEGADPVIFVPIVNFKKLTDPCIIDAFWRNNVFFWSEEHARENRRKSGGVLGIYVKLVHAVYITRASQSALFKFKDQPWSNFYVTI